MFEKLAVFTMSGRSVERWGSLLLLAARSVER
jgi:hypothetical protein